MVISLDAVAPNMAFNQSKHLSSICEESDESDAFGSSSEESDAFESIKDCKEVGGDESCESSNEMVSDERVIRSAEPLTRYKERNAADHLRVALNINERSDLSMTEDIDIRF